jgi:hypothetical protein
MTIDRSADRHRFRRRCGWSAAGLASRSARLVKRSPPALIVGTTLRLTARRARIGRGSPERDERKPESNTRGRGQPQMADAVRGREQQERNSLYAPPGTSGAPAHQCPCAKFYPISGRAARSRRKRLNPTLRNIRTGRPPRSAGRTLNATQAGVVAGAPTPATVGRPRPRRPLGMSEGAHGRLPHRAGWTHRG